jgi:hypothetical protein
MNKKALTPIVSILLLLVFAVGLGIMVMSWGNSPEIRSDFSCKSLDISLTSLSSNNENCYSGNTFNMVLENNGLQEINDFKVVLLLSDSNEDSVTQDIKSLIYPGEFKKVSFDYTEPSKILKIRLIPFKDNHLCIEKRIEIEQIKRCKNNAP